MLGLHWRWQNHFKVRASGRSRIYGKMASIRPSSPFCISICQTKLLSAEEAATGLRAAGASPLPAVTDKMALLPVTVGDSTEGGPVINASFSSELCCVDSPNIHLLLLNSCFAKRRNLSNASC